MNDAYREHGTINSVKGPHTEDHGILTTWVFIDFTKGCSQGFGGIMLDAKLAESYTKDLCAAFGVKTIEDLAGKKCYALKSFSGWNEPIEGIESADTGCRFLHNRWRKKHFMDTTDVLSNRKKSVENEISFLNRRLDEEKLKLTKLSKDFVDWDNL